MFSKPTKAPLNQGQEAVAKEFFDFLLDPNASEFNISGPGGTECLQGSFQRKLSK